MKRCPYCGTTSGAYEQSLEDHILECQVSTRNLTATAVLVGAAVNDRERRDTVTRAFEIADQALKLMEQSAAE